jgi:hypothetical protein
VGTPTYILSLFDEAGNEQVIFQPENPANVFHPVNPVSITVSADGGTVCVFGEAVYILRQRSQRWIPVEQLEKHIDYAAFINGSSCLLGVIPYRGSWLKIRDIDNDWLEIAAVWLPSMATCLSSTGNRIIVGTQSGHLLSYEFMANDDYPAHIPQ